MSQKIILDGPFSKVAFSGPNMAAQQQAYYLGKARRGELTAAHATQVFAREAAGLKTRLGKLGQDLADFQAQRSQPRNIFA